MAGFWNDDELIYTDDELFEHQKFIEDARANQYGCDQFMAYFEKNNVPAIMRSAIISRCVVIDEKTGLGYFAG